jgi:hypothetical protein
MNPKLNVGDRIVLLYMDDESSVTPGTKGKVTSVSQVFGDDQYNVDWDNGSKLALISSVDVWDTEENYEKRKRAKKK